MRQKATRRGPRGQVLPVGLALLACAALLCGLCFRLGSRMLQQERTLMRADLTAYSGGIQTARCLNLLSYSEKIRMAGELVGDIPLPVTKAIGAGIDKVVGAFQKLFIPAAPWAVEADVVAIGLANEVGAIPLWNQPDALGGFSLSRLKPDLKVKAGSSAGGGNSGNSSSSQGGNGGSSNQSSDGGGGSGGFDLGALGKLLGGGANGGGDDGSSDPNGSAYHYDSGDGQRHDLDDDQAGAVIEHGPHGTQVTRYKDSSTHKYVAKDRSGQTSGYGMTDLGGHYVAVLALQAPDGAQPWARPGWTIACAQVRIAGGDVNAFDGEHGADYAPFFAPVRDADDDGGSSGDNSGVWTQALGLAQELGLLQGNAGGALDAAAQALQVQH